MKYEKDRIERMGPQAMRDVELLGEVIGSYETAELVLAEYPKETLVDMDVGALARIDGITKSKAKTLVAVGELTRRGLHKGLGIQPVISSPGDTIPFLADIKDEQQEHFVVLHLNARHQVARKQVVAIGSISACIVHPREVFRTAMATPATAVILAHNHPSGDPSPSQDDINLTRRLVQAGEIVGIDVLDHKKGARGLPALAGRGIAPAVGDRPKSHKAIIGLRDDSELCT